MYIYQTRSNLYFQNLYHLNYLLVPTFLVTFLSTRSFPEHLTNHILDKGEKLLVQKRKQPGVEVYTFNPSIQKKETGRSLSSRSAKVT